MPTAREKTTEGIPIWSLVIIWIISLYNMVSSRYVRQTEEEMERLLSEKDSKNTKRAISTSVKCFRNYLRANGIDQEFESFETGVLDSRLKEYYASVRKADGEHNRNSSSILATLQITSYTLGV
jgi:hypothetical protein